MIDTLAEAHGQSIETIENKYTRLDYYRHITRKSLDNAKDYYKSKQKGG